jgi:hypothetical protein
VRGLDERRLALDRIARAEERHAARITALQERATRARDRVTEARSILRDAEALAAEAAVDVMSCGLAHDLEVGRLRATLIAGAPAVIDEFLAAVQREIDEARLAVRSAERAVSVPLTDRTRSVIESNSVSVGRRVAALHEATRQAGALKLTALAEPEILARLEALRDGIPAIEPLMVETAPLLTPGESRAIAWRIEEARR